MSFRDRLAINVTPLVLRVGVGVVFLWAGSSKLLYTDAATGPEAAQLANLGIVRPAVLSPGAPAPTDAAPTPTTTTPAPEGESAPPAEPAAPESAPPQPPTDQATPAPTPTPTPEQPASTPPSPKPPPSGRTGGAPISLPPLAAIVIRPSGTGPINPSAAYTAEDFPQEVRFKRLYRIAQLLERASTPDDKGRRLWPKGLSDDSTIRAMAWAAALTEFVGAGLILAGFLTRLAALGLSGTMLVAMLLTTIGPAVLSGQTFLGFLPDPKLADQAAWPAAWQTFVLQVVTLAGSLGLLFSGAGSLSIDRLLFVGRSKRSSAPAKVS